MRVTYVLPEPILSGGNKVSLQQVAMLDDRGHRVAVLAKGERPSWSPFRGRWLDCRAGVPSIGAQDVVVATFWPTVATALELDAGPVVHFCQGYEGSLEHNAELLPEIERVYNQRLPSLVVAPHLERLMVERFGRPARIVSPVLDPLFRPAWRLRPNRQPLVMVPGIFEAEVKQVKVALAAVRRLRALGVAARVARISVLPLSSEEEALCEPAVYLCDASPQRVAETLRGCDLLLFPSRGDEGFGLPLLEAMASKVPAVATRIPSTEYMAAQGVVKVEAGDAEAMAAAAAHLLRSPRVWRSHRRLAWREAQRFRPEIVGPRLEEALAWACRQARGV